MTGKELTILVTAVGGELGQSLIKALRLSTTSVVCYGTDIVPDSVGSAFVEKFFQVPPATHQDQYIEELNDICRNLNIDLVIPASEPEIVLLSRFGNMPCGSLVICQPEHAIHTFGDKLNCMDAMEDIVDLALYADGTDQSQVERLLSASGFPVVVKPRRSSGSRQLSIVNNRQQLTAALSNMDLPLVQDFIDDHFGEFSVGAFKSEKITSVICFKRELGPGGASWDAENLHDEDVMSYARKIIEGSQLTGSVNIQVRKSSNGVRLLEINPRFSSLVAVRALSGFTDLEWSIDLALGRASKIASLPFRGVKFKRFIHEVVDVGEGFGTVSDWMPRNSL